MILPARPQVTTSASLIAENDAGADAEALTLSFLIKNKTGTASVFLGDEAVTTGTGYEWEVADGPIVVELEPGETLYGVASTNQTLHTLRGGR